MSHNNITDQVMASALLTSSQLPPPPSTPFPAQITHLPLHTTTVKMAVPRHYPSLSKCVNIYKLTEGMKPKYTSIQEKTEKRVNLRNSYQVKLHYLVAYLRVCLCLTAIWPSFNALLSNCADKTESEILLFHVMNSNRQQCWKTAT